MHACELLPVAAIVADSATSFIRTTVSASSHLHDYWSHSRERLDCWTREFATKGVGNNEDSNSVDPPFGAVLEEILFSEVLTRVWVRGLLRAKKLLAQYASAGNLILFVGTKKQASEVVERE